MAVKPIPDGYHSVTPFLIVPGAAKLLDFLQQAFEAQELHRMPRPDGTIMHAEVRIGDSLVMMGEPMGDGQPLFGSLYLYVHDVDAVYKRDDVYTGPFLKNASELQVGFADGYRVSWQTSLGGSPPGIVYPNMKKWSGDHGSYDYKQTAGTLISSRQIDAGSVDIMDIAPTVLKYFGVPIPPDIDGKPIF